MSQLFVPLIILAIIGNVLWFTIKGILTEHGVKVNYWFGHFRDIPNFKRLIGRIENKELKTRYLKYFWGLIITLALFVILGFYSFAKFNEWI